VLRKLGLTALALTAAFIFGERFLQTPDRQSTVAAVSASAPPAAPTAAARTPTHTPALPDFLPAEAQHTVALILRGGPFPYAQDGSVFGNRERLLPQQPRGWYHEYTVDTPGLRHRGARRIVTGGTPPREWFYTDDHYRSFRPFDVPRSTP
jgi:ribonuclease T1